MQKNTERMDANLVGALASLVLFFIFLIILANNMHNQTHTSDVGQSKRYCEEAFDNNEPFVRGLSKIANDCELLGERITDYDVAHAKHTCLADDCAQEHQDFIYWQKWEQSCRDNTGLDSLCHRITDLALPLYHF